MAATIDDVYSSLSELITILKNNGNQGTNNSSGSISGVRLNDRDINEIQDEFVKSLAELSKSMRNDALRRNKLDREAFGNSKDADQVFLSYREALIKQFSESVKLEQEKRKYELDEINLITERIKIETTNQEYQHEQQRHNTKLAEIEANVRKEHINEIKSLYEREEKIREGGLADLKQKQDIIKGFAEITASDVATKDKDGNAYFSARKELLNKVVLAPFQEKWMRVFGGGLFGRSDIKRTDSVATSFARGTSALLNGFDKFTKSVSTGKMDVSGMADKMSSKLMKTGNPYAMAAGAVVQILKTAFEMYSKVDKAASDYARSVGGGTLAQVKMRRTAAELAVVMGEFGQRTYNAEKILANMAETSEVLGRNLEYLSTADLKAITDLKDFGISNNTISDFDTLGLSVERVSEEIASIYGKASKHGLNAKAVTKAVADNLKMAQNYTFARGRKAIFEMAEKSTQLKFNLRDAEAFANKVGTLEGAMKTAAQLSVLGGNFAMQGNPMTLLYNALNDVEGLQDQMLAMTKNLVYWDENKQQLDMSAFDRQRIRATAEASGIDYGDFMNQAFNQERVRRISRELPAGLDKDTAEYIKNIATLDEHGNARIQFHNEKGDKEGEAQLLSDVLQKPELVAKLKGESEAKDIKEGATVGDILNNTRSIQDKLDDLINQVKNYLVRGVMRLVDRFTVGHMSTEMYGFNEDQQDQFSRLRNILTDKTLTTASFSHLSRSDKEALKAMKILDKDGKYIGRTGDERYSWGDRYGDQEIAEMLNAYFNGSEYKSKNKPVEVKKRDEGGYNIKGDAISEEGELVIPKEETQRLIKNGENPLDFKKFKEKMSNHPANSNNVSGGPDKPIRVEFGTLHLELAGVTKDIDMNAFANILLENHSFIQTLIQKMANTSNFGFEKDNAQFPVANNPYSNMA